MIIRPGFCRREKYHYIYVFARARIYVCASVKNTRKNFLQKSCKKIWSIKNKSLSLQQQTINQ